MTASLVASLGVYGGVLVIAFVAGLFPIVSVEVFLIGLAVVRDPSFGEVAVWVGLAAIGHQLAKTLCYFAGTTALERGRIKPRVEAARARIERWNRHPYWVMVLGATVGLPPMYLLAFIAHPMMRMRFVPFTAICLLGRIGRYATLTLIPVLAQ